MSSILPTFPVEIDNRDGLDYLLDEYVTIVAGAGHVQSLLGEEVGMGEEFPSSLKREIDEGRDKVRTAQMLSNTLSPNCITPEVRDKWIAVLSELKEKATGTPKTPPRKIEQIDSYINMFRSMENVCVDREFPFGDEKIERKYY